MEDDIGKILITSEEIQAQVQRLAQAISQDYAELNPLFVGVLKGIVYFVSDLMRALTIPVAVDFLSISSYGPGLGSTGTVRLLKDLDENIQGRHVLVVEDVIDTGLTLGYILKNLRVREPASLKVCTLFDRPYRRLIEIPIAYKGFDLPNCFVVGYGLDYEERYRNLPFIGILKEEILGVKQRCN